MRGLGEWVVVFWRFFWEALGAYVHGARYWCFVEYMFFYFVDRECDMFLYLILFSQRTIVSKMYVG